MKLLLAKQTSDFFYMPTIKLSVVDMPKGEDHLGVYRKAIGHGCSCITIVTVDIDGYEYDVIADDEALVNHLVPTVYVNDEYVIFGSVLFAKANDEGETIGLNDEDIKRIRAYLKRQHPALLDFLKRTAADRKVG